jgi:hypothetical protein
MPDTAPPAAGVADITGAAARAGSAAAGATTDTAAEARGTTTAATTAAALSGTALSGTATTGAATTGAVSAMATGADTMLTPRRAGGGGEIADTMDAGPSSPLPWAAGLESDTGSGATSVVAPRERLWACTVVSGPGFVAPADESLPADRSRPAGRDAPECAAERSEAPAAVPVDPCDPALSA